MGFNIIGIGIANGIGFKGTVKYSNPIEPEYNAILLESGSYLLLENGNIILLEDVGNKN